MKWRTWLAAPIALALGGCDFAPRYAPPSVSVPSKFKDETARRRRLPPSGEWWLGFNDRTLNDLQAQVDAANPDLAAAVAANDAAVARANAALSSAYPQVDADPHFLANKQSANRPLRSANAADLLRRQSHRRANGLRGRHLGTGSRSRRLGECERGSERGCARRREARTARGTRARLRQSARLRRSGQTSF